MINFRSNCPIGSALDIVGDKWSLLVIRDMLLLQKSTFKEFESSDEKIATNILSNRLQILTSVGMVSKHKLIANKKTNIYLLTPKGYDLADILVGFLVWGNKHLKDLNPEVIDFKVGNNRKETSKTIDLVIENYKVFRESKAALCLPNSTPLENV